VATWAVLGLSHDPVPGDPSSVRTTAQRFGNEADVLARISARLGSIASASDLLMMEGDYAASFSDFLNDLPGECAKSERAYRACGQALATFGEVLGQAQAMASAALTHGTEADTQFTGAVQQIRSLLPPDRTLTLSAAGLAAHTVDAATMGLDESLRVQIRAAATRARYAEADRDAARRLALQAAQLRGDGETTCAAAIDDSLQDIKNKGWLHKAWDAAVSAVSWPFTSWDHFLTFCGTIALVCGVVALFVSGPIGWGLMAAATVAGGVIAGDGLVKYAQGKIGLGTLALDLLGVLPGLGLGGRAAGVLARLGREIPAAGRVLTASTRVSSRATTIMRNRLGSMPGLRDYTGSGYIRMNRLLRSGGEMDAATARRIQAVSDDLAKLPPVKGPVYRGTHLEPHEAAVYQPGRIVREPAFTSTTSDPAKAFPGNTRFYIDSQTGKDVSAVSMAPHESEILFDRGTVFKVLDNVFDPATGQYHIYLREMPG
jgi:hypothetical protein